MYQSSWRGKRIWEDPSNPNPNPWNFFFLTTVHVQNDKISKLCMMDHYGWVQACWIIFLQSSENSLFGKLWPYLWLWFRWLSLLSYPSTPCCLLHPCNFWVKLHQNFTSHGEKGFCLWFLLISFILIIDYGLQMITKVSRFEFFHQPYKYVVLFIWVLVYDHLCWISGGFVCFLLTSGKMGDRHVRHCFLNHVVLILFQHIHVWLYI
jgi:hypothetical protein